MRNLILTLSLILGLASSVSADIIMTCDRTAFTDETTYKFSEGWMFMPDKIYVREKGEWLKWCEKEFDWKKEVKDEYGVCKQVMFYYPDGEELLCIGKKIGKNFDFGKNSDGCVHTIDFIKKAYTLHVPNAINQKDHFAKCR